MPVSLSFCLSRTRLGGGAPGAVGVGCSSGRSVRGAIVAACFVVCAACSSSSSTVTSPSPTSARCPVTLALAPATIEAAGGSGQITITVNRECAWEARSESDWITLAAPTSGQGEASLRYTAAANALVTARRGAVMVNEQRIEVPQSAAACRFDLSAPGGSAGPEGGSLAVTVNAQATCAWTAVSQVDWVQIDAGRDGNGQGVVTLSVERNTGVARQGSVLIAGQGYAVSQAGATTAQPGCAFNVTPPSEAFQSNGGEGTIRVAASGNNCAWSAVSSVPWITVTPGGGSGTSSVRYVVAANPGGARVGAVVAAGTAVTVTQGAAAAVPGCELSVSPQSESFAANGGDGTIRVSASGSSCPWTAVSNAPWITVSTGSGNGSGNLRYAVAANPGAARTGTLTVAGATITVSQAAAAASTCEFETSPSSESFPASGGENSVRVRASNSSCPWTAVSNASWITLAAGGGTGDGNVRYAVAANTGPARTGTMTVARGTVTVRQDGAPPPCQFDVSPRAESFPVTGGEGRVRVEASGSNCNWTATSNAPWITLTNSGAGTGGGDVRYVVAPNLGGARTGTLTVAQVTVTVSQSALVPGPIELRGDLSGLSGDCPNVTFTVDSRLVRTTSATVFDGRCDRLRNRREVSVQGLVQGDGSVLALRVRQDGDD